MAKIKFTKTELKKQQDAKKQFERFLPTLQLKKQQLQMEVRHSVELLEKNARELAEFEAKLAEFVELFGPAADAAFIRSLVVVRRVRRGELNIAGISVPTFEGVDFKPVKVDLVATDWYVDDAVAALKAAVKLRESRRVLEERCELLNAELRSTSQRVNLFEKVKIPECRENIRRIGIMLGDANTSAVARCKIAKRKSAPAA
jgi:V/A-type H+-transporting ATPase subunit D